MTCSSEARLDLLAFLGLLHAFREGIGGPSTTEARIVARAIPGTEAAFSLGAGTSSGGDTGVIENANSFGASPTARALDTRGDPLAEEDEKVANEEGDDRADSNSNDVGSHDSCAVLALVEEIVGVESLVCICDVCDANVACNDEDDKEHMPPWTHGRAAQDGHVELGKSKVQCMLGEVTPCGVGILVHAVTAEQGPEDNGDYERVCGDGADEEDVEELEWAWEECAEPRARVYTSDIDGVLLAVVGECKVNVRVRKTREGLIARDKAASYVVACGTFAWEGEWSTGDVAVGASTAPAAIGPPEGGSVDARDGEVAKETPVGEIGKVAEGAGTIACSRVDKRNKGI